MTSTDEEFLRSLHISPWDPDQEVRLPEATSLFPPVECSTEQDNSMNETFLSTEALHFQSEVRENLETALNQFLSFGDRSEIEDMISSILDRPEED